MAWQVSDAEIARIIKSHDEGTTCPICVGSDPDRCVHFRMALAIRTYKNELAALAAHWGKVDGT